MAAPERVRRHRVRSIGGERQACLKAALPVWQVVLVAHSYGTDAGKTAAHFGWPVRRVRAALNYYEAFPDEIDRAIVDSHAMTETALRRLLPQMETLTGPAISQHQDSAEQRGESHS